jgi:hypothetical protein
MPCLESTPFIHTFLKKHLEEKYKPCGMFKIPTVKPEKRTNIRMNRCYAYVILSELT